MKGINLIGVDFGTTNSCVCYTRFNPQKDNYEEPQTIDFVGQKVLRTLVLLDSAGHKAIAFGDPIYKDKDYVRFPERAREEFKIRIGSDPDAALLTTLFFQNILAQLTRRLGVRALNPANEHVIVGVPAQWTLEQQAATRQAVLDAGFPAVETAPEPVGAMLYHYFAGDIEFGASDELTLVIDFGGGTTDFVVVKTEANGQHPAILRTYGERYGGRNFDDVFFNYLYKNYWRAGEMTPAQRAELLRFARKFKEDFSLAINRGDSANALLCTLREIDRKVNLTLEDFQGENLGGPIIQRFAGIILAGLQQSHLTPRDIRRVILTGGSARWYFVKQAVQSMFNCPLVVSSNPEQTIAKGLCLIKADLKPRARPISVEEPVTSPETNGSVMPQLEALAALSETELQQCRDKARRVIWKYVGLSSGVAILPIPYGTSLALAGLETTMVMEISQVYGYHLTPGQVGKIIGGLVAGGAIVKMAVNEALIFVPGIGWVARSGVAAAAVKGLGEIAIKYFENSRNGRGTPLENGIENDNS